MKENAASYLWTVVVVLALALCVPAGLFLRASLRDPDGIPPLKLSGSTAFDRKAWFVRHALHRGTDYDVVAVGSSMTMNDLSSNEFTKDLPGRPILNIASWAMRISDSRRWLLAVLKVSHPKTVLMVTSALDFYPEEEPVNVTDNELSEFLTDRGSPRFCFLMLRKFSFSYNKDDYFGSSANRAGRSFYLSLDFDRGGAVPLEISYPNVDGDRWSTKPDPRRTDDAEYQSFNSLAADVHSRGIRLVVVQAPMRPISYDDDTFASLQPHWQRVQRIVAENGGLFVPTQDELHLDDSYFCDYSHLNAKGTIVFTRYVAQRIRAD